MKHVILLPTYNEAENIESIISRIFELQPEIYVKVVDDNSPDGTGDIVKSLLGTYPNLSLLERKMKEGLGKAYIHGFREVMSDKEATHIFMMDSDHSHNPACVSGMIEYSQTYSLVIGSRYTTGGKTEGWELWRRLLSFFGNMYAKFVTGMPVNDVTGGFNCISIEYLRKLDLNSIGSSGYAFIMELKYLLYKNGVSIKEIPITFENRLGGESKMSGHIISEGIVAPWKMRWK